MSLDDNKEAKEKEKKEGRVMGFLHLLEEMDKKGESETSGFGEIGGFNAKAKYGYSVKLEPELGDLPRHRGFHPRKGFGGRKKTKWR